MVMTAAKIKANAKASIMRMAMTACVAFLALSLMAIVMIIIVVALHAAPEAFAQQPSAVSITAVRQFAVSPLLPESGGYVSYELVIRNDGNSEIGGGGGHELRVRLSSEGGRSESQAAFSISSLGPGEAKLFHVGPFKIAESGLHSFHASLEGPSATEGIYEDSFVAYDAGTGIASAAVVIAAIVIAASLVAAVVIIRRRMRAAGRPA
jgi:uncharacterized membrane protein YhaH (DUF805 family)